jgi:hypothetical protein
VTCSCAFYNRLKGSAERDTNTSSSSSKKDSENKTAKGLNLGHHLRRLFGGTPKGETTADDDSKVERLMWIASFKHGITGAPRHVQSASAGEEEEATGARDHKGWR